jgi:GTPase SAR1 family protein
MVCGLSLFAAGVNGVILVYDITDRASYDNAIGLWLAEVGGWVSSHTTS